MQTLFYHPLRRLLRAVRRKAGFSLIEVNMAIFVLAGGALALMALFPLGLRESLASRSEMRISAFAERLLGAAQMAANDPKVASVDDVHELVGKLADVLSGPPFNFELDDDPGDYDSIPNNPPEDPTSGVYYHAWILEDTNARELNLEDKVVAQIGVQVTAENAKQNPYALRNAPVYVIRVAVDKKNKR